MEHNELIFRFEESKREYMGILKMLSSEMSPIVDEFIKNKDFESGATYLYNNYPDCSARIIQLHRLIVSQDGE